MLTESRIVSLIIYVKDIAVSRAFYENTLGFRPLEENEDTVKYDAGHIILWLNRNPERGRSTTSSRNYSANITFLVDNLEGMRAALEARGVKFFRTIKYNAGLRADFYDPDGRWFSLYEPSEEAMQWPSGDKIRAFLGTDHGATGSPVLAPQPASNAQEDGFRLDGTNVIYFFLFVKDWKETFKFYHDILGLRNIEGGPCKRGSTQEVDGVIKYDVGGTLLTTHHVDDHTRYGLEIKPEDMKGIVPVFHVANVEREVQELDSLDVELRSAAAPGLNGTVVELEDPAGHALYLYEPLAEKTDWPRQIKPAQILTAPL
jgi:catechol 2,3-dioxygenase-like lactoylglutathione lyase family enzyme